MNFGMYKSTGILRYATGNAGVKLIVEVDPGITAFYKSLIPKYYVANPQKYAPHISVVRKELPPRMDVWGKYEGQPVDFYYDGIVREGTVYWWLDTYSVKLEEIRLELGLPVSSPYTLPPEGFSKCFHTTLANKKSMP